MAQLLYRLGERSARFAWNMIAIWVFIIALAATGYSAFHGTLANSFSIPGSQTQQLSDELAQRFPSANKGTGQVVVSTADGSAMSAEQQQAFTSTLEGAAKHVPQVDSITDPFAQKQQLKDAAQKIHDAREQIDGAEPQFADAWTQINNAQAQIDGAIAQGMPAEALAEQQTQVNEQKAQLEQSEKEFPDKKSEFERQEQLYSLLSSYRSVSEDGSTAIATVIFDRGSTNVSAEAKEELQSYFKNADLKGLQVNFSQSIAETAGGGMGSSEIVGVAIALIVLIVMLGTLIAAGLPILMALVGVIVGVLGTLSFSSLVQMSSTTYILGMMLGLAVGIDYSLFIVNRHRQNLMRGEEMRRSIALANGTSGNAVVFAGLTVIIALVALNVTGIPFLGYMGNAAALCVAVAVLVSVTLTPAVLSVIGRRIMPAKLWAQVDSEEKIQALQQEQEHRAENPHGWVKVVTARPVATIILSVMLLGALAIPMSQMRLGLPDASASAVESTDYKAYQQVKEKFGEGMSGPVVVVAHTPEGMDQAKSEEAQIAIASFIKAKDNVATVIPAGQTDDHTLQVFQVIPTHGPASEETEKLVQQLRESTVDVQNTQVSLGVTGLTGGNIDVSQILASKLPLYLAVVLGLSFIVMILVFRSIIVPLVATVGFLGSILASFGAVVAIYQLGFMGSLFGVHDPGPVLSFLPTLMIGILFGLAMDYQVFLVSGMREEYVHGREARQAVVTGYNHAVRVVVAAMIIMISVFGGFMFAESAMIRPMGFGLAFGVLVDAFIVRMTLTPAVLTLLGDKAWWIPEWLDRVLPQLDVEGASLSESEESDEPEEDTDDEEFEQELAAKSTAREDSAPESAEYAADEEGEEPENAEELDEAEENAEEEYEPELQTAAMELKLPEHISPATESITTVDKNYRPTLDSDELK